MLARLAPFVLLLGCQLLSAGDDRPGPRDAGRADAAVDARRADAAVDAGSGGRGGGGAGGAGASGAAGGVGGSAGGGEEVEWALQFGDPMAGEGVDEDVGHAIAASASVVVGGAFMGRVAFGPFQEPAPTTPAMLLLGVDWSGIVQWLRVFDDSGNDRVQAVALDPDGAVYAAGYFNSNSIDLDGNHIVGNGPPNAFVMKLDPTTHRLVWHKHFRTQGSSSVYAIAHSGGLVVVGGAFREEQTLDPGGTTLPGHGGFVVALEASTGAVRWAKPLQQSTGDVRVRALDIGGAGEVFVGGDFSGPIQYEPGMGATARQGLDGFLARLEGTQGRLEWHRELSGLFDEEVRGLRVTRGSPALFAAGYFTESVTTSDGLIADGKGGRDAYLARFELDGDVERIEVLGGPGDDVATSLDLSVSDELVLAGVTDGAFDYRGMALPGPFGGTDVFVVRTASDGQPLWMRRYGGPDEDGQVYDPPAQFGDVAVASSIVGGGQTYLTGSFRGVARFGTQRLTAAHGRDLFVVKIR